MTASLIQIVKDKKIKSICLAIGNPFTNIYSEAKDLCDEMLVQIFSVNKFKSEFIKSCSYFDKELEDLLIQERLNINSHWDLVQYSNIIKKYA